MLPDVYWMKAGSAPAPSGAGQEAPRAARSPAVTTSRSDGTEAPEHRGHAARASDGDERAHFRVGEDRRLPLRVFLEPVEPRRRDRSAPARRPP